MAKHGYNTILSNVKGGTPDIEDWPVTYDEMVPYYNSWEKAIGVVGDTTSRPFHTKRKFSNASTSSNPMRSNFQNCR